MADIFDVHGSSVKTQAAQRSDGQWFKRIQKRSRFGLTWSRWTPVDGKPDRCYMVNPYAGKARLPK